MHGKVSTIIHDNEGVFSDVGGKTHKVGKFPSLDNELIWNCTPFSATRYHSLVGAPYTIPSSLQITAYTQEITPPNLPSPTDTHSNPAVNVTATDSPSTDPSTANGHTPTVTTSPMRTIMGVRHREYTVEGVQFHPESVTTEDGKKLLSNFLRLRGGIWKEAYYID